MALKIKEEFKEYSVGGGKLSKIKLSNLDPSLYETYSKLGWSDLFAEEKEEKKQKTDVEKKD